MPTVDDYAQFLDGKIDAEELERRGARRVDSEQPDSPPNARSAAVPPATSIEPTTTCARCGSPANGGLCTACRDLERDHHEQDLEHDRQLHQQQQDQIEYQRQQDDQLANDIQIDYNTYED